ncbi:MAG TPA: hypothetical protein VK168_00245 [Saprospiraceae bacterium]|nr:hypothetical protein [Saprospiraceae bacterium]
MVMKSLLNGLQKQINMKNLLLCLAFLTTAYFCQAQKPSNNELGLGFFVAGEFFDTSAFKVSPISGKNFSLTYTRLFDKKLTVGVNFTKCGFHYLPTLKKIEDNSIFWRVQKTFSADLGYRISKWSISATAKAGIRYNMVGYKVEHYASLPHSGGWLEGIGGSKEYGKIGAKLGAAIQHPIIWRFFGELDCEYARMFSGGDRNQLLLSYRIGFRF